ncbi:hypothetical protein ACHAWU_008969 [Discostella pseudostelligera]|uniref:Uncharacterized protein n=1 Tax=Discostella pseudostelligera TaxID=259834 RepID=A0ABD3MMS1_9STRA
MPPIPLAHPSFALLECSSSSSSSPNITARKHNRSYHTSPPLHRPGYKPERNPKIKISLEQLRMAARTQGRRLPICHEQHEKVMNSLEAAKYENHAIYKYVKEYHKCREDYELNHKGKDKAMMRELNKYLVRDRKK